MQLQQLLEKMTVYLEDKMQTPGLGFDHVSFGINSLFDDTDTSGNGKEIDTKYFQL